MKRTLRQKIFKHIWALMWTLYHVLRYGLVEADRIAERKLRQERAKHEVLNAITQERMWRKRILN